MRILKITGLLLLGQTAFAQADVANPVDVSYSYAELRFVDVDDNGGDGFRFMGSWEADPNWLLVGGITALDFDNNVDTTLLEVGGGYVWHYDDQFDLIGTLRLVRSEVDTPGSDSDDTGFAVSAGVRGLLAPQFEVRGFVNHLNLDDSDTFLEIAGDYYFNQQFSAGLSLEFAGDNDLFTIGARYYFK
ncbi:MAG: outer membrane beta-barrel protein [Woeseiaceae bacterium]|nr:outer membrane beta-barrel protein [Woeseiaceae bacterium]